MIGGQGERFTNLLFDNTDGDCIKLRGTTKVSGITIVNSRTADATTQSACLHIINSAYGFYSGIITESSGDNYAGVALESRYDIATVTSGSGNGVTPISLTLDISGWTAEQKQHALPETGESWLITGATGNTNANGTHTITLVSTSSSTAVFTLNGTTGNGTFGGTVTAIRATDPYYLVHLGSWYNTFDMISPIYNSSNTEKGWGIAVYPNPTASGTIVNPPGQSAGSYTIAILENTFKGFDVENKTVGIYLSKVFNSTFINGIVGCATGIYARGCSNNTFVGTRIQPWVTAALDFDAATCSSNTFVGMSFFNGAVSQPWQIGPDSTTTNAIGAAGQWMGSNDAVNIDGVLSSAGFSTSDQGSYLKSHAWSGGSVNWDVKTPQGILWNIGARNDNGGISALYSEPAVSAPSSSNYVMCAEVNTETTINCGGSGYLSFAVANTPIERLRGWSGSTNTQTKANWTVNAVLNTSDTSLHTIYKYAVGPGSTGNNGSVVFIQVRWTARDNTIANMAANSGGGLFTGLFFNNGGGSVTVIGSPTAVSTYGAGTLSLAAGTGGDSDKILVQVTAGSSDSTDWQVEVTTNEN